MPLLVAPARAIGVGLSAIHAATARHGFDDLDLFAVVADDQMTDVDGAIHAGAGAQTLEAGIVRLYSVVVILGGWVRVGCARLFGVHSEPPSSVGRAPGWYQHLRGHFFI